MPRLPDDPRDLVRCPLRTEPGEPGFQKHQARTIFQRLAVAILAAFFDKERHAFDQRRLATGGLEQLRHQPGVMPGRVAAPFQVTAAAEGKVTARAFPAFEMLSAHRDRQRGIGPGIELAQPVGHPLGISQLRAGRILPMQRIDGRNQALELPFVERSRQRRYAILWSIV